MRMRALSLAVLLLGVLAVPARAQVAATRDSAAPAADAPLALSLAFGGSPSADAPVLAVADPGGPVAVSLGGRRARGAKAPKAPPAVPLGGARARILLRSLTVPGWGQATLGHRGSAAVFAFGELGVWGAFTAFRIQVAMRTDSYLRSARVLAGIDLRGRDEEWRRIVGAFRSNDEYNLLVVARDAANLHYDDPAAYRAYYEAHALRGADAWSWGSDAEQERYRGQRKDAQRAARRANTALAVAIANRLVSALHAARVAGQPAKAPQHSWRFEVVPAPADDALAFQMRVRATF